MAKSCHERAAATLGLFIFFRVVYFHFRVSFAAITTENVEEVRFKLKTVVGQ